MASQSPGAFDIDTINTLGRRLLSKNQPFPSTIISKVLIFFFSAFAEMICLECFRHVLHAKIGFLNNFVNRLPPMTSIQTMSFDEKVIRYEAVVH